MGALADCVRDLVGSQTTVEPDSPKAKFSSKIRINSLLLEKVIKDLLENKSIEDILLEYKKPLVQDICSESCSFLTDLYKLMESHDMTERSIAKNVEEIIDELLDIRTVPSTTVQTPLIFREHSFSSSQEIFYTWELALSYSKSACP